jgi:hypothetical protein
MEVRIGNGTLMTDNSAVVLEGCAIRLECSQSSLFSRGEAFELAYHAIRQCVFGYNPPHRAFAYIKGLLYDLILYVKPLRSTMIGELSLMNY